MKILVNNKEIETSARTVAELVAELSLPDDGVAMGLDGRIVARTAREDTALHEGASVIIVKAACGG